MQGGPADEHGLVNADTAHAIAIRPVEAMEAVGPIGTSETVTETMAEPAMAVETSEVVEPAVVMEAAITVEAAMSTKAAMMRNPP